MNQKPEKKLTLKDILEREEKANFKLLDWTQRLIDAKEARSAWDTDYARASAILSNQVETGGGKNDLSQFTDKMFHTNWLLKLCIWLESYIQSADIYFDLKSHTGADDYYPDRLMLEMELNRLIARFEMARKWCRQVIPSRVRYGYGVSYSGWNAKARDGYYRNGKPNFIALDPRRVWVDDTCSGENFCDRRWTFCKVDVGVDDAKIMFPEYAEKIAETPANTSDGDNSNKRDRFDYYICQYKTIKTVRMVDATITMDQKQEVIQFPLEQVLEFNKNNPDGVVPENMVFSQEMDDDGNMGYDAEITAVYQFMFSADLKLQLTELEYVGDVDQFQFWCNHRIDSDIYPRGTAYMLQDEQTIKSILLTKVAIEVIKNGRATPIAIEGAIKNWKDYVKNHNNMDYIAQIDAEWYEQHKGEKAIDFIENKFDFQVPAFLNSLIKDEMQQFSGGTDSMMGQAQYAGMSAAQTGLLQASGATYTKSDELSYRDYIKDIGECYGRQIADFMSYEHTLDGVDEKGRSKTVRVNVGDVPDWNFERYEVEPIIENSPEMIKQLKEQRAMQLKGMGAMGTVRMLMELGYPNAEQIAAEAYSEMNILAAVQKLQDNPELLQRIMEAPEDKDTKPAKKPTKKASNA